MAPATRSHVEGWLVVVGMQAKGPTFDRATYFGAKLLAQASQNLLLAALYVTAGTSSDAAVNLSSLMAATLLPAIAFGLAGGAVVDRVGPARGFALGALLRFLPVLAAVQWLEGAQAAWIVAFLYSTGSQVFTPAEMALVRSVQTNRSGGIHSFLIGLQYAGQGLGILVLAPALYYLGGTEAIITGSAVGFALLVGVTTFLAFRLRNTPAAQQQSNRSAFTFRQTCSFFAGEPRARYAVVLLAFKVIVMRGIIVTLPFYLEHDLGLGAEAVAYLLAPGVAGALLGLAWTGRSVTIDRIHVTMRMALVGMVVAVMALAALDYGISAAAQYSQVPPIARLEASMNTTFVVAVPAALLLGMSISAALVSSRAALTETAPDGQQARVFAVQLTLTEVFIVLPLMVMGYGTEFAGARSTLAAIGVAAMVALAVMEVSALRRAAHMPLPVGPEPLPVPAVVPLAD